MRRALRTSEELSSSSWTSEERLTARLPSKSSSIPQSISRPRQWTVRPYCSQIFWKLSMHMEILAMLTWYANISYSCSRFLMNFLQEILKQIFACTLAWIIGAVHWGGNHFLKSTKFIFSFWVNFVPGPMRRTDCRPYSRDLQPTLDFGTGTLESIVLASRKMRSWLELRASEKSKYFPLHLKTSEL